MLYTVPALRQCPSPYATIYGILVSSGGLYNVGYEVLSMQQQMPTTPQWHEVPQILSVAHTHLSMRSQPLDTIIAVVEVCFVSLRKKVEQHMFHDMKGSDILDFGKKLQECDKALEACSTALILKENPQESLHHLSGVFRSLQDIWNAMVTKDYIRPEEASSSTPDQGSQMV